MINKNRLENLTNEVWKGAIKLRGKFKAKDYPSVILPMIMIRRIECVLEENRAKFKADIIAKDNSFSDENIKALFKEDKEKGTAKSGVLTKKIKQLEKAKLDFFNTTDLTLKSILSDSSTLVETNFRNFLNGFSANIEEIVDKFEYRQVVTKMVKEKRLSEIIQMVAEEDFSPTRLSNIEMGYVYENLLQRFSQDDAKDTGEHFTPREIIRIMVDLMEIDFNPETATKAISLYDPACGTGGMLSVAKEHLIDKATTKEGIENTEDLVMLNGQELLSQNYAVCKADMLLKGEVRSNITNGNSLIPHIESIEDDGDQHTGKTFDYMISNPPFGVDWSPYKDHVLKLKGSRYAAGMSPSNDGALLFLSTMIEKMKPKKRGGSKIAILFNGSPLSNGDATSGESEIRRYILENDLLDSIVMVPDQMFYNTGIYTYIWVLNNNKPKHKKEHALIINAREHFEKEPKSFGNKRNRITDTDRTWIHDQFEAWESNENCKKFHYSDFAFHKVKVTFWQENENGKPMWIEEDFTKQLNNANVKKAFDLYGDFTMKVTINDLELELNIDGKIAFETLVVNQLKLKVADLKEKKVNDIKAWFKGQEKTATYNHRHYITDNEYIPFDKTAKNKESYINAFLAKEIDYEIIDWAAYENLGYEILPNKYFYKYQEPESSDVLIDQFWELEDEAKKLLKQIRTL
ncbi:class I SAM-dependent DNA methyltransferase [Polaribacter sp. HaHaR_3_91]|uniref:class I SAM-dependent DNA methyltransferase n=1 Tax=Polaribacter sp. HaHaR_3_91 TaxID=2745561 RepID=UPI001C4EEF1A|nr:class I SAM-dependent DNA methyltransferase [Polaribacter sp. HaHaR_3_91]QXP63250.1 N-6 DNA methylase [Polaribacter sp. HaHaR_3_91]